MAESYLTATLVRATTLTPAMRRLTFDVPGFASTGSADEWVHIFLGERGDHRQRRNYTIRRVRGTEVDVDVALHPRGLMVDWTLNARPGDALVWGVISNAYAPPADAGWQLLAGDLSALPALGRIVEELPAGTRAHVIAETFNPADRQIWQTAADVEVVWLHGSGDGHAPSRIEEAVRAVAEPAGPGYWWVAGETRSLRPLRRWLREREVPKQRWSLTGYWLMDSEAWSQRYEQHAAELETIWEAGEREGRDPEDVLDAYNHALDARGL